MPGEVILDSIIKNKAATKSLWEKRMRDDFENKKREEENENQRLIRKTSFKFKCQSESMRIRPPTTDTLIKTNTSPSSLIAAKESAFNRKLLEVMDKHEALKVEFEKLEQINQEISLKLKASVEQNLVLKTKLKELEENFYQNPILDCVKPEDPIPITLKSTTFAERKGLKREYPKSDDQNPSEPAADEAEAESSKRFKINRSNSVKDTISIFEQVKNNNRNFVERSHQSYRVGSIKGRYPLKMHNNMDIAPQKEINSTYAGLV